MNLSANFLASIQSDRQRTTYMQSVYRHYFSLLNPHNLWLFSQSFVKRKTLNLRKDCGAAAHAAAAAAALGTSISFMRIVGDSGEGLAACRPAHSSHEQPGDADNSLGSDSNRLQSSGGGGTEWSAMGAGPGTGTSRCNNEPPRPQEAKQKALVAGTKVKRTFACQTLIMCSNVQMHCDRSFKLMSLLNPLQATWIKTDHLLVLEERPDKVCQTLRLFLQGIGYSMSTYERRLKMSATLGGSGDSQSSM